MGARTRALNVRQVESWRMGIKIGMIRSRLERHIMGELELSATQVRAAEILLRKVVPDLSSMEYKGQIEHKHVTEYSDAELLAFVSRSHDRDSGAGVVAQAGSQVLVADLHGVHDAELESGEDPPTH